jgi:mannose-6-phosphate isomerase-like protein (cupin superfamily)
VKDGEFKVQAGEKILRLKMNDSLIVPRGMPHSFVKTSDGDARLIVMHQPAVKMENGRALGVVRLLVGPVGSGSHQRDA